MLKEFSYYFSNYTQSTGSVVSFTWFPLVSKLMYRSIQSNIFVQQFCRCKKFFNFFQDGKRWDPICIQVFRLDPDPYKTNTLHSAVLPEEVTESYFSTLGNFRFLSSSLQDILFFFFFSTLIHHRKVIKYGVVVEKSRVLYFTFYPPSPGNRTNRGLGGENMTWTNEMVT